MNRTLPSMDLLRKFIHLSICIFGFSLYYFDKKYCLPIFLVIGSTAIVGYDSRWSSMSPREKAKRESLEGLELARKHLFGKKIHKHQGSVWKSDVYTANVNPWDTNYYTKHGREPSLSFLREKKLELEKLISKDGMKTKKKRSHVNKSSGTVVTNPRPRSKRDRLSKEAESKARWDEKKMS